MCYRGIFKNIDDSRREKRVIEFVNRNGTPKSKVSGFVLDYCETERKNYVTITFHMIQADEAWIKVNRDYPIKYNIETLKGEIELSSRS